MRGPQAEEGVAEQIEAAPIRLDEAAAESEQRLAADTPVIGQRACARGGELDGDLRGEVDTSPLLPQQCEAGGDPQVADASQQRRGSARRGRKAGEIALLRVGHRQLHRQRQWAKQMCL